MGATSSPSCLNFAATSSHLSALRLEITTLAPACPSASAIANPIPLVEPVTIATLPVKSNNGCFILFLSSIAQYMWPLLLRHPPAQNDLRPQYRWAARHSGRLSPAACGLAA